MHFGGEALAHAIAQAMRPRHGGTRLRVRVESWRGRCGGGRRPAFGGGITQRKTAKARVGALAGAAYGLLARGPRQRQGARAGERAEQNGIDHGAGARGEFMEIGKYRALGQRFGCEDDALAVEAAVAQRYFFVDGVDAMRRSDQRGALGRDIAVQQGAPGFEQFGSEHDVDVGGCGCERHHHAPALKLGRARRVQLDVVGGRAGALRDAGDGGALHRVVLGRRGGDDPVGKHAAAFAAERGDQDGDRSLSWFHLCVGSVLTIVVLQRLRAARANRLFCTDKKRIRTEKTVMDKSNSSWGLIFYKIVDCIRMGSSSVRNRRSARTASRPRNKRTLQHRGRPV